MGRERETNNNLSCQIIEEGMRVTPIGFTSTPLPADQYPMHGLGFYEEEESSTQLTTYIWSCWTNKAVQPLHVNQSLMNMLNGPVRGSASTSAIQSKSGCQDSNTSDSLNKGSGELPSQSSLRITLWMMVPRSRRRTGGRAS